MEPKYISSKLLEYQCCSLIWGVDLGNHKM